MNTHHLRIEIEQGEVAKIIEELSRAQETIIDCYRRLELLGVLSIKEETPSGN